MLQEMRLAGFCSPHQADTELVPVLSITSGTRAPAPCQLQGNKENKGNTSGLLYILDITWSCRATESSGEREWCKSMGANLGK